jgi:hypothetical protein
MSIYYAATATSCASTVTLPSYSTK